MRKSIYASLECESLHAMAMCTLWQAARSSIISAAIQNSLSAIGHSATKPGSQVEAALIGKRQRADCSLAYQMLPVLYWKAWENQLLESRLHWSWALSLHLCIKDQAKKLSNIARCSEDSLNQTERGTHIL